MDTSKFTPSVSRTYVIPMYNNGDFTELKFNKFVLPEDFENTCSMATWYYYNRVDFFGCGFSAIPFEQYSNLKER
jgi:hypothetical protein